MHNGSRLQRLTGLIILGFGLAVLVLGGYLVWNSLQARIALARAGEQAATQVVALERHIASLRTAMISDAFRQAAQAVLDGEAERVDLIKALREQKVGNVLNVVVAEGNVEELDFDAFPGGGFAALQMMLQADRDGSAPAQVHFAGTPDEYLALAERLQPDVVGASPVVLLSLPVSVLVNQIRRPDSIDSMSLVQQTDGAQIVIEEFGRGVLPGSSSIDVRGTMFRLDWHRTTVIGPMSSMQLAGIVLAGLLTILLGVLMIRRTRQLAGSADSPTVKATGPSETPGESPEPLKRAADTPEAQVEPDPVRGPDIEPAAAPAPRPLPSHSAAPELHDPASESSDGPSQLTADGEARRETTVPRSFDAPELSPDYLSEPPSDEPLEKPSDELADELLDEPPDELSDEPLETPLETPLDEPLEKPLDKKLEKPLDEFDSPDDTLDYESVFEPEASPEGRVEMSLMLNSLLKADASRDDGADDRDDAEGTDPASAAEQRPERHPSHVSAEHERAIALPSKSIFRAYDIRGIVGDTLSAEIAEAIGQAIGSEARHRGLGRIAVARDGRLSGAELLAALSRGLVAAGLEVIDVGAVPTPVLYYAAQELAGGSGVMVTGSHNPPDYNGFKIMMGGETLSGDSIYDLHRRLETSDLTSGNGSITAQRITAQYIERIGTDIQLERPLKVVADCGNGIAGAIAPKLLAAIGAEVIPLYAEVDGTFPNHHPDPGDPATLEDLKLCVRNFKADIGVAFDGDGDRLGVVAPDGEIIYPDRLMMLFARDVLSRVPGAPIIFDVKCSSLLPIEIEKAGGKPVMARTGHSYIKQQLKREQAPLAGEMSGHFFFGERWYGFDDGIYAAARLLEILAADTRATGQILASLPKAESTPELKVEMKEGESHPFVEEFQKKARFEGAEINTLDGVRADFADGFGLVRASNTTPVLVLRFEGKDKKALARIKQAFRTQMLAINPALKIPF
ncbi:MAG: hypothetical protein ABR550_00905 [Wenzhouxiangellaceae bacterium]